MHKTSNIHFYIVISRSLHYSQASCFKPHKKIPHSSRDIYRKAWVCTAWFQWMDDEYLRHPTLLEMAPPRPLPGGGRTLPRTQVCTCDIVGKLPFIGSTYFFVSSRKLALKIMNRDEKKRKINNHPTFGTHISKTIRPSELEFYPRVATLSTIILFQTPLRNSY